jgi:hypothetical protein
MKSFPFLGRFAFLLAPEHGGDAVTGGGHPANVSPPSGEAIADAFDEAVGGRGQTPGLGVPGSMGLPVGKLAERIRERAQEIWEAEGRPDGRAEEHWLLAEAEIAASSG